MKEMNKIMKKEPENWLSAIAKKELISVLKDEQIKWSIKRNEYDGYDSRAEYYKAHAFLYLEAISLIKEIIANEMMDVEEFKSEVYQAIEQNDWGWGSNWNDTAHRAAINEVKNSIYKFFATFLKNKGIE